MWWIIGIYLAIGAVVALACRATIGMALINPLVAYPVVVLLWPILLFLFMLGNI